MKKNCWEIMGCGRELGGQRVAEAGVCPAASIKKADGINSGKNAGRICWAVAGTVCDKGIHGDMARKSKESCLECEFYKLVEREEGKHFELLLPGQLEEKLNK